MKDRLLHDWTFMRLLYLAIGIMVMIQTFAVKEWIGFLFGAYFASMGLFRFGCAAGNCYTPSFPLTPHQKPVTQDIIYEEIKP